MEDLDVASRRRGDAADRGALLVVARIAPRRHHHRQRRVVRPSRRDVVERAIARLATERPAGRLSSRIISTWHSGSPKRTLYSISFGPSRVIISPAIEHAAKGRAALGHARHRRRDDLAIIVRSTISGVIDRGGRDRRPCRRCWAGVAIADPLVVLRGGERQASRRRRTSTKKLASSPSRNSSITTSAPAAPKRAGEAVVDRRVGLLDGHRHATPLPAARPSALTTIGAPRAAT